MNGAWQKCVICIFTLGLLVFSSGCSLPCGMGNQDACDELMEEALEFSETDKARKGLENPFLTKLKDACVKGSDPACGILSNTRQRGDNKFDLRRLDAASDACMGTGREDVCSIAVAYHIRSAQRFQGLGNLKDDFIDKAESRARRACTEGHENLCNVAEELADIRKDAEDRDKLRKELQRMKDF